MRHETENATAEGFRLHGEGETGERERERRRSVREKEKREESAHLYYEGNREKEKAERAGE